MHGGWGALIRDRTAVVGSVLLLVCAALTGCSVPTPGRAVPADTGGPRPVPPSALRGALLDSRTISDIMGASGMTTTDSRAVMLDSSSEFTDHRCLVAWSPAERTVYADTGWTDIVLQAVRQRPGSVHNQYVLQALVRFPSRQHARDFFDHQAVGWPPCGERKFATRYGDQADSWTFDAVADADSTLWMTQRQDNTQGWSCQRALRVSNNVAVDVLACKLFANDEGVTVVDAIDRRLPSA